MHKVIISVNRIGMYAFNIFINHPLAMCELHNHVVFTHCRVVSICCERGMHKVIISVNRIRNVTVK